MSPLPKAPSLGSLRRKITIQSIATTPTVDGETTGTTTNVLTAWASIEPLSGQERLLGGAQQDLITHRIRMLYQPGITAKMQAKWDGRIFNFVSVIVSGELNRDLEILAVEDVSA